MHVKIKDFIGNQYADFAIYLSTWYLFNVHLNIREYVRGVGKTTTIIKTLINVRVNTPTN